MRKDIIKIAAVTLIIGSLVSSASVVSVNAEEDALLKEISVSENLETCNEYQIGGNDLRDNTTYMREITEVEMPYYVGKQKKSFLKDKEYDKVLYLGVPCYLPMINENAVYFSSSDDSIATIEGNELIGKKQGLVTITAYNAKKKVIDEIVFAVTTYNDNKDVINATSMDYSEELYFWDHAKNPEYWKTSVNTIQDACFYFQAKQFTYSFNEPDFCGVQEWQWTADPETIFTYNTGVCVQIAQMGDYLLADNFQDWGNILVFGNQGHIFNWYYEDGYYYIVDFTEVASRNAYEHDGYVKTYYDCTDMIHKFTSINQIKKWISSEKVDIKQNYLVVMYSNQGHDYMPAWKDGGCFGIGTRTLNEGKNIETAVFGFQDIVYDELKVLYKRKGLNMELKGFSIDEMPVRLEGRGIYGYQVETKNYFEYK